MENISRNDVTALADFFERKLPLNRKEVYYTATVLPGIICADGFKHFDRFLKLLGLEGVHIQAEPANATNIQFFTEYNFNKTKPDGDQESPKFDGDSQQPDLVIFLQDSNPIVIVIEGKMYVVPTKANLTRQMEMQEREIVARVRPRFKDLKIVHAALVPAKVKNELGSLEPCPEKHPRPIISWEQIVTAFDDVESAEYFNGVLKYALDNFEDLKTDAEFGLHADAKQSGVHIVNAYLEGEREYLMMGRKDGLDGASINNDIETRGWLTQKYEVKRSDAARKNWFSISEFVKKVTKVS